MIFTIFIGRQNKYNMLMEIKANARNRKLKKSILCRLPWLALLPFGLLLPRIAAGASATVETGYAQNAYPVISGVLSSITQLVPVSLAEIIVLGLPVVILLPLIWVLIKVLTRRAHILLLVRHILGLAVAFGTVLTLFYPLWGFNYFREPLAQRMDLDVQERSVEELSALCYTLRDQAVTLRGQVAEDDAGVFALPEGYAVYFDKLPGVYEDLGKTVPLYERVVIRAKPVYFSRLLSYTGISGVYFPFTAEPNVNVDQPPLLLLSSAAHEMAHGLGIAPEDEANFMAYLSCMQSDDPAIRYSGVMLALIHSGNQLYDQDYQRYQTLRAGYSEGMLRDLEDHAAYWAAFDGPVEDTFDKANDSYLKHNKQEDGVKSYGQMVDLLLAYYDRTI